jgi:hypothetical protein
MSPRNDKGHVIEGQPAYVGYEVILFEALSELYSSKVQNKSI